MTPSIFPEPPNSVNLIWPFFIGGMNGDKHLCIIWTSAKIHSSRLFCVARSHSSFPASPLLSGPKGAAVIVFRFAGAWAALFCVGVEAFVFGGAKCRRARTSGSRSEAQEKRALPDGFLIPLLFSRSSAICDVKKPNLIIRLGQVSELTRCCDSPVLFSFYVQITATPISLETLKKKKKKSLDQSS